MDLGQCDERDGESVSRTSKGGRQHHPWLPGTWERVQKP